MAIEVFSPFLEIAPRTPGPEDTGGVKSDMRHGALKIHRGISGWGLNRLWWRQASSQAKSENLV